MGFILRDKKAEKECTSKIQLTPQYKYTKSKFDTQIKEMLLTEQKTEKKNNKNSRMLGKQREKL